MSFNLPKPVDPLDVEHPCSCFYCAERRKEHGRCSCITCGRLRAELLRRIEGQAVCSGCGHDKSKHRPEWSSTERKWVDGACFGSLPFQCNCTKFEPLSEPR